MGGEGEGLGGTGDGGTGGTARDGGGVDHGSGCVGGTSRAEGFGVVSSPGVGNTGGGSENEKCGLHCDFGWIFLEVGSMTDWKGTEGIGKGIKRLLAIVQQ